MHSVKEEKNHPLFVETGNSCTGDDFQVNPHACVKEDFQVDICVTDRAPREAFTSGESLSSDAAPPELSEAAAPLLVAVRPQYFCEGQAHMGLRWMMDSKASSPALTDTHPSHNCWLSAKSIALPS
jgi:hypothetical protein